MTTLYDTAGRPVAVYSTTGAIVFGDGKPASSEKTDPASLTALRHVATHCSWWRGTAVAGSLGNNIVSRHTVTTPAKALRFQQGAGYTVAGKLGVLVGGSFHRVTWSGSELLTLNAGDLKTSDPLPDSVQVEAGQTIYTVFEVAAGDSYPAGYNKWDTPVKEVQQGPYTGGIPTLSSRVLSGAPSGIHGLTLPASGGIACFGDSILESGWMRRAAHDTGAAWSDFGQWAEAIPTTDTLRGRLSPANGKLFALGLTEYATNNRHLSQAELRAALIASWGALGKWCDRLGQTTMVPYTTSTDSWATLDGQSETHKVWRDALNAWLSDGAPIIDGVGVDPGTAGAVRAGDAGHPLVGICDIAAAVETTNSRGEHVWRIDGGKPTPDGVHPTRAGADLMQPVAKAWFDQHL